MMQNSIFETAKTIFPDTEKTQGVVKCLKDIETLINKYFYNGEGVEYKILSYVAQKETFRKRTISQLSIMAKFGLLSR